jgi:hypothetical protein
MNKVIFKDLKHATEDTIKDLLSESQGKITSNNYEVLGELIDIHKDIANEEYWCYKMGEGEDMRYGHYEYDYDRHDRDDYGARRRDARGRYRGHDYLDEMYDHYGRYMEGHERYGANEDTKRSLKYMLESMEDFARMLREDAQSQEEVEMIRQTAQRIAQM